MWVGLFSFASLAAVATAQAPPTALDKQLERVELGISGMGVFAKSTTGPDGRLGTPVTDTPSTAGGVLVNLRYIKSPLVGLEFNYTSARSDQDFTGINVNPDEPNTESLAQVQTAAHEYTFGWVFHTPKVFGIGTFASAGAGTTAFKPTKNGGEGYLEQARATYYYSVGVEEQVISPHFGLRASFRQAFYLAPDYEINYFRNLKRTIASEPNVGIYFRF